MADDKSMSLREAAGKLMSDEHADVLAESVAMVVREVMEAEVSALAGAAHYERTPERIAHRNGYRARQWDTRVGTIELAIPRLRTGSYLPSFLEPRRRSEQALVAVVQEAYVNGSAPARSSGWSSSSGWNRSPRTRSRACAPCSTSR